MSNIKLKITKSLIPHLKKNSNLLYGTSGYRSLPELIPSGRVALIAYMRSSTLAGKRIGIIVTASHNPPQDNGIKLIDHTGEMFDQTWEGITDKIVNSSDKDLYTELNKFHRIHGNYRPFGDGPRATILLGRDTRESGPSIIFQIKDVLKHFNCSVIDYEEVSTPQLHWLVAQSNLKAEFVEKEEYFKNLVEFIEYSQLKNAVRIDTSNGVAKNVLKNMNEQIEKKKMDFTFIENNESENIDESKRKKSSFFILTNPPGPINEKCGAAYVQYNMKVPDHLKNERGEFIAFDGDADRIIYFYINETAKVEENRNNLEIIQLDGDRQASILINFFTKIIRFLNLNVKLGCILSDYSNLSAFRYCESICETVRARTGIKNFIKGAKDYDIGIYNEPNGHGGIYFSNKIIKIIEDLMKEINDKNIDEKSQKIILLSKIIKMHVNSHADPLLNLLVLEYIKMTDSKLFETTYTPSPCRQLVVYVKDQNIITIDKNLVLQKPLALKVIIDRIIKNEKVRVFVRGSGTESLIRVFCEAEKDVDSLCLTVAQAVYDICGGIGAHPEISYV